MRAGRSGRGMTNSGCSDSVDWSGKRMGSGLELKPIGASIPTLWQAPTGQVSASRYTCAPRCNPRDRGHQALRPPPRCLAHRCPDEPIIRRNGHFAALAVVFVAEGGRPGCDGCLNVVVIENRRRERLLFNSMLQEQEKDRLS